LTSQETSQAIRIVIACRDPLFGGALASAAEASTIRVAALVDSFDCLSASVVDGETDGIVAVDPDFFSPEHVIEIARGIPLLVLGAGNDVSSMIGSVEAGALGYADLEAPFDDLVEAIRSVVKGVAVIPPLLLGGLLRHVVERQRHQRRARARLEVLSARERQVFELTARGYDKQAIADKLFISPATARTHVQNVFRKLNLHSTAELVALASECGLDLVPTSQRGSE
jgi:DNA-binding NarL/FixJ family response regulator